MIFDFTYTNTAQVMSSLAILFITLIAGVMLYILFMTFINMIRPAWTYLYRKDLANLYVAARVRQRADKDNINLESEESKFIIWKRKNTWKPKKDLDDKILEQLNAEVQKDIDAIEDSEDKK